MPPVLQQVRSDAQRQKIAAFRRARYRKLYPAINGFDTDPYDQQAVVLFTESGTGEVTSTARIVFDGRPRIA